MTDESTAEIEAEIGHTRAELGRTLDALEHKLAARHMLQEGIAMVTDSLGAGDSGRSGLAEVIRANPISVALIGAGVGWLIASNTGMLDRIARDERVRVAVRQVSDLAGTTGGGAAEGGGWVHRAAGAARGAIGAVRDTGSAVVERAGAYAEAAGEYADRASRVAGQASGMWERHALLFGAAGLLSGAFFGALLPLTKVETE